MRSINSIDSISLDELVDELKIRSVVFLLLPCCSSAEDEDEDDDVGDEQLKGNQVCLLSDVPSGLEGVCLSFGRPPRRVQQYCFFQS